MYARTCTTFSSCSCLLSPRVVALGAVARPCAIILLLNYGRVSKGETTTRKSDYEPKEKLIQLPVPSVTSTGEQLKELTLTRRRQRTTNTTPCHPSDSDDSTPPQRKHVHMFHNMFLPSPRPHENVSVRFYVCQHSSFAASQVSAETPKKLLPDISLISSSFQRGSSPKVTSLISSTCLSCTFHENLPQGFMQTPNKWRPEQAARTRIVPGAAVHLHVETTEIRRTRGLTHEHVPTMEPTTYRTESCTPQATHRNRAKDCQVQGARGIIIYRFPGRTSVATS